ncbi:MAG: hypothetical protein C0501_31430, partial [Isosphaera sp.]|nr:hypothetical protein [Isosphaera sp.]
MYRLLCVLMLGTGLYGLMATTATAQENPKKENRKKIYVPKRPGLPDAPSAASLQAAVDMAVGPTDIDCDLLTEDGGFLAQDKDIRVGISARTVVGSMTFVNCVAPMVNSEGPVNRAITFEKCKNVWVRVGEARGGIRIDECEHVLVNPTDAMMPVRNRGIFVSNSTGVNISSCLLTESGEGVVIRDCLKKPPAEWSKSFGDHPVRVVDCKFTKLRASTIRGSEVGVNAGRSRVKVERCTFEEYPGAGVMFRECIGCDVFDNNFRKLGAGGIYFFDTEGTAQANTIGGALSGIHAATNSKDPKLRTKARLQDNTITGVGHGIVAHRSTLNSTGNRVTAGAIGVLAADGCDGVISDVCVKCPYYGIGLIEVAKGFTITGSLMEETNIGLGIHKCEHVIIKNNHWTQTRKPGTGPNGPMINPVTDSGIQVFASIVEMDNVTVQSAVTTSALSVVEKSTVRCSGSFASYGDGAGVFIEDSTLTGNLRARGGKEPALHLDNSAKVKLTGEAQRIVATRGRAILVEGNSTLDFTKADVTRDSSSNPIATDELILVDGGLPSLDPAQKTKARLAEMSIAHSSGVLVRVKGHSECVLDQALLSGNQTDGKKPFSGPEDGLLVEGGAVDVIKSTIKPQGRHGLRVGKYATVKVV